MNGSGSRPTIRSPETTSFGCTETESIIWVRLNIIGYGRGLMPLGVTSRIGSFRSDQRGERHKHAAETNHHRISIRYHFH